MIKLSAQMKSDMVNGTGKLENNFSIRKAAAKSLLKKKGAKKDKC